MLALALDGGVLWAGRAVQSPQIECRGLHKYALIFLCSGLGGVLRYVLGEFIQGRSGRAFPLGTLFVNTTGCLGIGFFAGACAAGLSIREEYRVAVLAGLFGGYTTFSAFGRETVELAGHGHIARAGGYVLLSVVLGLAAVWAGAAIGSKAFGAGPL